MEFKAFSFYVEGILLVTIGFVGLVGNAAIISWFSRKKNIFHRLMTSLAVCDSAYIITNVFIFSLPKIFKSLSSQFSFVLVVTYLLPVAHILMTASIYLTLAITLERYTTVFHPWYKVSRSWRSQFYIVPILLFSILYNTPKFFELEARKAREAQGGAASLELETNQTAPEEVDMRPSSEVHYSVQPTALRVDRLYVNIYLIFMNLIINGIVPFLLLLGLNVAIYSKIRQMQKENFDMTRSSALQRQKEIKLSQISIAIAAVFITCHTVKWIPNIWEAIMVIQYGKVPNKWPGWVTYVACLSHLLIIINSSVNFFIYFIKYQQRKSSARGSSLEMETMVR